MINNHETYVYKAVVVDQPSSTWLPGPSDLQNTSFTHTELPGGVAEPQDNLLDLCYKSDTNSNMSVVSGNVHVVTRPRIVTYGPLTWDSLCIEEFTNELLVLRADLEVCTAASGHSQVVQPRVLWKRKFRFKQKKDKVKYFAQAFPFVTFSCLVPMSRYVGL